MSLLAWLPIEHRAEVVVNSLKHEIAFLGDVDGLKPTVARDLYVATDIAFVDYVLNSVKVGKHWSSILPGPS